MLLWVSLTHSGDDVLTLTEKKGEHVSPSWRYMSLMVGHLGSTRRHTRYHRRSPCECGDNIPQPLDNESWPPRTHQTRGVYPDDLDVG